ncbi:glycosyltransferase family 4 protein [Cryobacterium psychrophilum]|uniref:D-inositol 3-phosphate glycosyltransferase n=1 Tax=Cryobacterium psychrophilum TaxID=41988 RepID=A0A4Y8KP11_9MICO|nr:glycosyltransferase family 4 protein [Cryobacterium psychrophilum]TFD79320.1 glycosyltransferase [Cryobacterium psychrophilum]
MSAVEVCYPLERNLPGWIERFEADEVPGRWPYGLHELAPAGLAVTAASVSQPGRAQSALARLIPAAARARLPRFAPIGTGLAWDENVAVRMSALRPRQEMYCGVIWVTDRVGRSGVSTTDARLRSVLRGMRGIFVNSRAQVAPLREFLGAGAPSVEFIRFGVDETFWRAQPYPEVPLIVSVGGDRDRDAAVLYEALSLVHASRPEVEIIVQSASSVSPPPGVTRVGHFTHVQLQALYARASVVAVATKPNLHASGLTVSLESMATGRPVVINDAPGLRDYIVNGDNGWLTPMGDPRAMSERVLAVLANPTEAAALGQRARASVEARFTTKHLARSLAGFMGIGGSPDAPFARDAGV